MSSQTPNPSSDALRKRDERKRAENAGFKPFVLWLSPREAAALLAKAKREAWEIAFSRALRTKVAEAGIVDDLTERISHFAACASGVRREVKKETADANAKTSKDNPGQGDFWKSTDAKEISNAQT